MGSSRKIHPTILRKAELARALYGRLVNEVERPLEAVYSLTPRQQDNQVDAYLHELYFLLAKLSKAVRTFGKLIFADSPISSSRSEECEGTYLAELQIVRSNCESPRTVLVLVLQQLDTELLMQMRATTLTLVESLNVEASFEAEGSSHILTWQELDGAWREALEVAEGLKNLHVAVTIRGAL